MADFKKEQRVKRVDGTGCLGTVVEVLDEVQNGSQSAEKKNEKGVIITVEWDNGTYSHFTPEALADAA